LRERPYTRTGDVLIAVNPYKWFDGMYSEQKRRYYSNRLVWEHNAADTEDPRAMMEPHVYEVSALAYKGLAMGDGEDQSILVSGESGAG
jgi:myosin heavy subunit